MKTTKLVFLLLIMSTLFPLNNNTCIANPTLLAYKVVPPPAEKKVSKKHKKKKYKKRHKRKQQVAKPSRAKGLLILAGIMGGLFLIFLLVTVIPLAIHGGHIFMSLLILVTLIFAVLFSLFLLLGLLLSAREKRQNTPLKQSETELRKEVPNLSEQEVTEYLSLHDQLTAAKVKKANFDKNLQTKRASGVSLSELKEELDSINLEIRTIERDIDDLKRKSKQRQ